MRGSEGLKEGGRTVFAHLGAFQNASFMSRTHSDSVLPEAFGARDELVVSLTTVSVSSPSDLCCTLRVPGRLEMTGSWGEGGKWTGRLGRGLWCVARVWWTVWEVL